MPRQFMLDIETEALTADAMVWSVALTEFQPSTLLSTTMAGQQFLLAPQPGRLVNQATVDWTKAHGDKELYEHWKSRVSTTLLSPLELHTAIAKTLGDYGTGNYEIWAKGAKFDFAVMQSYFSDYNLATPWHYRAERDLRTLQSVTAMLGAPPELLEYEKPEIPHNAASDAYAQARTAAKWIEFITNVH